MRRTFSISQSQTHNQCGVVLPIVLVMVLLLTLVSVTAMKNVLFEERMAGSIKRFSDTMQAADYMLGVCERAVASGVQADGYALALGKYLPQGPIPTGSSVFTAGLNWWTDAAAWNVANGVTIFASNAQADVPNFEMNCLAEVLDIPPDPTTHTIGDVPAFRITAFARRAGGNNEVLVQSTVRY
jgi:Tfp pilus assembly protein PilX